MEIKNYIVSTLTLQVAIRLKCNQEMGVIFTCRIDALSMQQFNAAVSAVYSLLF